MGRPINKKSFGAYAGTGSQIRLSNCWIPGEGSANTTSYILNQLGENKYLVKNTATSVTGVVALSTAATSGYATLLCTKKLGTGATATARMGVLTAAVTAGGTGYSVGNVLTLVGGTGTSATLTVSSVSGGVVTGVTITTAGVYSALGSGALATTGGAGTGCTITVSAYKVVSLVATAGGTGYGGATATFSSGAAAAVATVVDGVITGWTVSTAGSYTVVPTITVAAETDYVKKMFSNHVIAHSGAQYLWNVGGTTPTTSHVSLPLS